jgi:hypothetical protein
MGPVEVTDCKSKSEMIWDVSLGVLRSCKGTMTMDLTVAGMSQASTSKSELKLAPKKKTVAPAEPKSEK